MGGAPRNQRSQPREAMSSRHRPRSLRYVALRMSSTTGLLDTDLAGE